MSNLAQIERTPMIIATEINSIKEQTNRILLFNSIEIGRKLVEAKTLIGHGGWGEWLKTSVDYSQRTASNLIRIFDEFGSKQLSLIDNANSQALANLSYTQAVALLGLSEEEKEIFVQEHDLSTMSTRDINEAIKERDKAIQDKDEVEKQLQKALTDSKKATDTAEKLKKQVETAKTERGQSDAEISRLKSELEDAKSKLEGSEPDSTEDIEAIQAELKASSERIKELEEELKNQPEPVTLEPEVITETVEVIPETITKELADLKAKVARGEAVAEYSAIFKVLVSNFKDLLGALDGIKTAAPEEHPKYSQAVKALIEKMAEAL